MRHPAALGAAKREQLISAVDFGLQQCAFLGIHAFEHQIALQISHLIGFYAIEIQSNHIKRSGKVWEHAEDANRTGKRSAFSKDIIGHTRHIITTRSSIIPHRNDHRFLLLQEHERMMHLLAGVSRTATGINAQHYSFYIIIVS